MEPMDPTSAVVFENLMLLAHIEEVKRLNRRIGLPPPTGALYDVWITITCAQDGAEERLEGSSKLKLRQLNALDPNDKVWIENGNDGTKSELNGDDLTDLRSALGDDGKKKSPR